MFSVLRWHRIDVNDKQSSFSHTHCTYRVQEVGICLCNKIEEKLNSFLLCCQQFYQLGKWQAAHSSLEQPRRGIPGRVDGALLKCKSLSLWLKDYIVRGPIAYLPISNGLYLIYSNEIDKWRSRRPRSVDRAVDAKA